jgi:uncharacterized damage-inducible protein DinB
MTVADLNNLYDYGYWANEKLFDAISQLTPEQFTEPLGGGHESIRNTLVHVMSAEWGWLNRCGGPERGTRLNPADYPNAETLKGTWSKVEAYVREFLSVLKDEDLARHVEFTNDRGEKRSMPLGNLLQHAASHGVHHRGQVALMLRSLGYAPGNIDMLIYYAGKRGVPAW